MIIFSALLAASAVNACPPTISDTQEVVGVVGWQVDMRKAKRNLEYVSIYSGHPSLRRSLKPEVQGRNYLWRPGKEVVWVECHYRDSAAVLIRSIGVVRSCKLTKPAPLTSDPSTAVCELQK